MIIQLEYGNLNKILMINFNNIKSKIILFVNIYNIQLLQFFYLKI
jgi:hypothetical protein